MFSYEFTAAISLEYESVSYAHTFNCLEETNMVSAKRFTLAQIQLNAHSNRCPIFPICLYERKTFRNRRLMITACIDSEFVRHKLHSKFINGRHGGLRISG